MKISHLILTATLVACSTVASVFAATSYTIVDLGTLPGATYCGANGLNDRGDVVGACTTNSTGSTPVGFIWRNGTMTSTGLLPNGSYSSATAINLSGVVVGDGNSGSPYQQSWVTTPTGLLNFFPVSTGAVHAVSILNNGIIGGSYRKNLNGWVKEIKGAIWTPEVKDPRRYRTFDLPTLPGTDPKATYAQPYALNQLGQAVGVAQNNLIGQHAAFWNNDEVHSIVDLGTLPDHGGSQAYGLNDLGQAVGVSSSALGSRAVLWNNDAAHTPIDLGTLPGDSNSQAIAINTAGQVIGGSGTAINPMIHLFVWDSVSGIRNLSGLLADTSWAISNITAINNLGQIVGTGYHNGQQRAFIMTPAQ